MHLGNDFDTADCNIYTPCALHFAYQTRHQLLSTIPSALSQNPPIPMRWDGSGTKRINHRR